MHPSAGMTATVDPPSGTQMMNYNLAEEDEDAEHEDDPMMDVKMFPAGVPAAEQKSPMLGGGQDLVDEDAEGEQEDDDDDDEAVGPVKVPEEEAESDSEAQEEKTTVSDENVSNTSDEEMSDKVSSDGESDGGAEWEGESNDGEDEDGAVVNTNRCM